MVRRSGDDLNLNLGEVKLAPRLLVFNMKIKHGCNGSKEVVDPGHNRWMKKNLPYGRMLMVVQQ